MRSNCQFYYATEINKVTSLELVVSMFNLLGRIKCQFQFLTIFRFPTFISYTEPDVSLSSYDDNDDDYYYYYQHHRHVPLLLLLIMRGRDSVFMVCLYLYFFLFFWCGGFSSCLFCFIYLLVGL